MATFPSINDDNFYHRVNKIYAKYEIPKKKKTFDEICFPKKYELQIPQKFLAEYINPNTPYKGLLVYHKIGGGKTCVAINIAEKFKGRSNIIVILPASLKGNFRTELRSLCAGDSYLTKDERITLQKLSPADEEYQKIIDRSDERINKYYSIYSYNTFTEMVKTNDIKLSNTLLIIDEVHNMVSEKGTYYETLHNMIHNGPSSLRVVIMTATPIFDRPNELPLTMNLLLRDSQLPVGRGFMSEFIDISKKSNHTYSIKNEDKLKKMVKGYVSFYSGAPEYVYPKSNIHIVRCEMSNTQLKYYTSIMKNENMTSEIEDSDIFSNVSNNFYIGTRMVSNFALVYDEKYAKSKDRIFELDNLPNISMKYYKIIEKIRRCKGTVFVYSSFKELGGIASFVRALEVNGYKDYSDNGPGKRRFAIWSGDEKMQYREEIKTIFNNKDNELGKKIKIVLGTSALKEGVSFMRIQQVHIIEPYWNMSRLEQVMGRAIRFCSHKDIEHVTNEVDVYIYLAVHPTLKRSVDELIMNMAINKKIINRKFEKILKEAAIDCELFKNANNDPEDPIKCAI